MSKPFLKKILTSRFFLVLSLVFLILAGLGLFKIISKRIEVNKEISQLEQKIKDLEEHNLELTRLIDYFKSDDFKEKRARLDLGLKKPDETVIVLPKPEIISVDVVESLKEKIKSASNKVGEESDEPARNNIVKWWQYFFSSEKIR